MLDRDAKGIHREIGALYAGTHFYSTNEHCQSAQCHC